MKPSEMTPVMGEEFLSTLEEQPDVHSSSDLYARRFEGEVGRWMLSVQRQIVLKRLAEFNVTSVLDVGGGHAQVTPALVESGYDVTVFGSTIQCSNRLQELLEAGKCKFATGALTKLPFDDNAFDAVICIRQMSHMKNWKRLSSELSRVSRLVVLVDYPPLRSCNFFSKALFFAKSHFESNTTRPYTIFRDGEVEDAFQGCGFKPVSRDPQFFLPMVFHRMVKSPTVSMSLERIFSIACLTQLFGSPVILTLAPFM